MTCVLRWRLAEFRPWIPTTKVLKGSAKLSSLCLFCSFCRRHFSWTLCWDPFPDAGQLSTQSRLEVSFKAIRTWIETTPWPNTNMRAETKIFKRITYNFNKIMKLPTRIKCANTHLIEAVIRQSSLCNFLTLMHALPPSAEPLFMLKLSSLCHVILTWHRLFWGIGIFY